MMGQNETVAAASSSTLRRAILALLVAALMAATMALNAMPAFAAANLDKANTVGVETSGFNQQFGHGLGGRVTGDLAQEGAIGDIASEKP